MSRYRVTIRGTGVELRGHIDGSDTLHRLARPLEGEFGTDPMIVASPENADYNPFGQPINGRATEQ